MILADAAEKLEAWRSSPTRNDPRRDQQQGPDRADEIGRAPPARRL